MRIKGKEEATKELFPTRPLWTMLACLVLYIMMIALILVVRMPSNVGHRVALFQGLQ